MFAVSSVKVSGSSGLLSIVEFTYHNCSDNGNESCKYWHTPAFVLSCREDRRVRATKDKEDVVKMRKLRKLNTSRIIREINVNAQLL